MTKSVTKKVILPEADTEPSVKRKTKQFTPKMVNWYEVMPEKYKPKTHNPHYDSHHISLPFRSLIVGSSGTYKTGTLLNLIFNMPDTFERIVIVCKSKNEPLYEFLEEKLKDCNFSIHEGLENLPDVDSFNKEEQSLVVLDDLVLEKDQSAIADFYIRARKKGCSLIYISQDFYRTPIMIRRNLTHLLIKQLASMKDLTRILTESGLSIDKQLFTDMYKLCTQNVHDFMLVTMNPEEEKYRFRKNLTDFIEFDHPSS